MVQCKVQRQVTYRGGGARVIQLELTEMADYRATCLECERYWTAATEIELGDMEALLQDHEAICNG